MEWFTERLCNVIEIKNNDMIQSVLVEGSGIFGFCQRILSTREDREKRRCFRRFDHKTYDRKVV